MYRKEIDGLRALAVSAVVIFHFFPSFLTLGFLGVDVFFVISGYLITTHLIGIPSTDFSLFIKTFYSKRVKRLFPALFVFLFISTVFTSFIFLKPDLESYFDSLIATKTFWANWYFWRDGGYFAENDQLKPLLHMWSLSVEEQFYLIYPAFLFILSITLVNYDKGVFIVIFIVSLLSFMLWFYLNKIGGDNPAFFLSPARIWQFGLGAMFSLLHSSGSLKNISSIKVLSYLSFALLVMGLTIHFDRVINTILVTLGSALFIFSLNENNLAFNLLSSKLAIFVGKLSYSLYLYHWLIVVIILYINVDEPSFMLMFSGIAISFLLAWLSYRYIEEPFRFKYSLSKSLVLISLLTISSFSWLAYSINFSEDNKVDQLSINSGSHYRCSVGSFVSYGASRACLVGDNEGVRDTVLLGNSHALMYSPLFSKSLIELKKGGYVVTLNGCLPTIDINISQKCLKLAKGNFNTILVDPSIKHIVIATTWYSNRYIDEGGNKKIRDDFIKSLEELINDFKAHGKNVALISPIQIPHSDLASRLPRLARFGHIDAAELTTQLKTARNVYDQNFEGVNKKFLNYLPERYIETYRDLCDEKYCYYGNDMGMFFADSNHLSKNVFDQFNISRLQLIHALRE